MVLTAQSARSHQGFAGKRAITGACVVVTNMVIYLRGLSPGTLSKKVFLMTRVGLTFLSKLTEKEFPPCTVKEQLLHLGT
jgi:hypothetical protein